jgi:hypothetical protein
MMIESTVRQLRKLGGYANRTYLLTLWVTCAAEKAPSDVTYETSLAFPTLRGPFLTVVVSVCEIVVAAIVGHELMTILI